MSNERREDFPHTRLTRIAEAMADAAENHPEFGEDVKIIVMLDDDDEGGMQFSGYDGNDEAVAVSILAHLHVLAKVNGINLSVVSLPPTGDPSDN